MDRKSILRRIRESKSLKKKLEGLAEYREGYQWHNLYRCAECGQLWQESYAWNFGAKWYLFQVPPLDAGEWLAEPYVQPDELMMYGVAYEGLMAQSYEARDCPCREEGCENPAIRFHILCKEHYLASQLKLPRGRVFPPYSVG
ncbi:MAG: hypothetical protein JOZ96_11965 [Acidobacteria bacterium]|nr:hypothetical protein [Acidobacteriota bacterium]